MNVLQLLEQLVEVHRGIRARLRCTPFERNAGWRHAMKWVAQIAASLASIAACLLPAAALHAQPAQDTLRIRLSSDIRSTDPGVNRDANTDALTAHILEGLVAFREDTTVGLMLARSVVASADGKTYTFGLRQGVKFSNGAPLTADDVVFAWTRYMKPETAWRCLTEFDGRGLTRVMKVEAPNASTVVFTLDRPTPLFLTTLARTDCGGTGIYHRSSLAPDGKWVEPVGTGPFKLKEWKPNQYIDLARNPLYAALPGPRDGNAGNKTPGVAKVRFLVIPDPSAAKAALLSSGLDLIYDIEDEDGPAYRSRKDLQMTSSPTMGKNGLLIQTRDPLMKDVRLRRALALAINVPETVSAVTFGQAVPSRSAIPPKSPFYGPTQAGISPPNIAEAKKLVAASGYKGQPIKILTTKRYSNLFTTAILTQAVAREIGLNLDIEVLDWATLQDRYMSGAYQVISYSFSSRLDPSFSYEMFTGNKDKQPRKVWENPQAIDLVAQSMVVTDKGQRQAIFDRLDSMLREDVPAIWLYTEMRTSAAKPYVKGFAGWPLGQIRAWGVTFAKPQPA